MIEISLKMPKNKGSVRVKLPFLLLEYFAYFSKLPFPDVTSPQFHPVLTLTPPYYHKNKLVIK